MAFVYASLRALSVLKAILFKETVFEVLTLFDNELPIKFIGVTCF